MPSTVLRKVILVLATKSWLHRAQVVLILHTILSRWLPKITWKNPYLKFLKSPIFSLFIRKHNKQGKLASFTANILPRASFSAQVTDAKHTGLVTSIK